ncbi:hypothetical protein GCM10023191_063150 [Actinoallomurus oryzae]|uniref:Aldehyde dehydrogenase domain-containing protein n=1 Tax=Actinoallomurus oryzae TaxID=502180 RepID=A0ABP8QN39_9ACTN
MATPGARTLSGLHNRARRLGRFVPRGVGDRLPSLMSMELANFVDGEFVSMAGDQTEIVDPATGEVYAEAPRSDAREIDRACAAAARAFGGWRRTTPAERMGHLLRMADALMAMWKIGPALAAGNTIVLKPSDTTPASAVYLAGLFAGTLPPGVLNVVCGDRDTGAALAAHPVPAMVSITGSTAAGRAVARSAADTVKRAHLELGGNAPVVIFEDAGLEAAAEAVGFAGYFNAGQDCTAATRVIVAKRAHDAFVAALVDRVRAIRLSPEETGDGTLAIPPLNNPAQLAHVAGLVARTPSHAKVIEGGETAGGPGYFYRPTVVDGITAADELGRTELFGPVVTVQTCAGEADAIRQGPVALLRRGVHARQARHVGVRRGRRVTCPLSAFGGCDS